MDACGIDVRIVRQDTDVSGLSWYGKTVTSDHQWILGDVENSPTVARCASPGVTANNIPGVDVPALRVPKALHEIVHRGSRRYLVDVWGARSDSRVRYADRPSKDCSVPE